MTMELLLNRADALLARLDPAQGMVELDFPGVSLFHARSDLGIMSSLYRPLVCLVLRGGKQLFLAETHYHIRAGDSIIVAMDLPVVSRVVEASAQAPYLAFAMEIDMALVRQIDAEMTGLAGGMGRPDERAVALCHTDAAMSDCALRMLELMDRPDALPLLAPALRREMHVWLLTGPQGPMVRRLAMPDSASERIARVIAGLSVDPARNVTIAELAAVAGMSTSGFHAHFRKLTGISPLQYQKRLRLLEARRLMLADNLNAGSAARAVGYESLSQFSREYTRTFGAPPRRDVTALKAAA